MAAVSRDVQHDGPASGVNMPTAVALVLVLLIVIAYLAAKSQGALDPMMGAIRERRTRRHGAGLEPQELNSIPITRYKAGRRVASDKIPPLPAIVEEEDAQAPPPAKHAATTTKDRRRVRVWKVGTRWIAPKARLARRRPLQSCSICTEDFKDGDDVRRLPCAHIFHPRCIDPWLSGFAVTCPLWQVYPSY